MNFLTKSLENVNENYPNRFGVFLNLDLAKIDKPDFEKNNINQIENAVNQGVIGLKIYKNLGLTLRDSRNIRVPVDDDRLSIKGPDSLLHCFGHSGVAYAVTSLRRFSAKWCKPVALLCKAV